MTPRVVAEVYANLREALAALDTSEAVRAYWASGGATGQKLPEPGRLRLLAQMAHDLRLSPGKTLVLVQDRKGSKWRLTNLHGGALPSIVDQTSITRAQQMAARIEALRDADGQPFDWNSEGFQDRAKTWRSGRGWDIRKEVAQASEDQKEANKPKPKPTLAVTPKATPAGERITSVEQLRAHLATGGDEPDWARQALAKRLSTADRLELVADGSFFIWPHTGSSGRVEWRVIHSRTARGAVPEGHTFSREQAQAFAEGLTKLWDQNGNRFDWDAPRVHERLGGIPDESRDEQIKAILAGEEPSKPRGADGNTVAPKSPPRSGRFDSPAGPGWQAATLTGRLGEAPPGEVGR